MSQELANKITRTTYDLLAEHGLHGWTVKLGNAATRAGSCHYNTRVIRISLRIAMAEQWADTLGTIRHEVAHAIAGYSAGHGPEWKRVARELGMTNPRARRPLNGELDHPWVGTCPNGHTTSRPGAPRKPRSCSKCSPVFDLDYLFEWTKNGEPVRMSRAYRAALEEAELMQRFEQALRERDMAPA